MKRMNEPMNERIARLQGRLQADEVDAFLVTQNVDLYYFTGSMQAGYLLVPADGEPVFYVRRSVSRAVSEASVRVEALGSFRAFGERLAKDFPQLGLGEEASGAKRCKIATEFDCLPVQLYHRLQRVIPQAEWTDGSAIVRELRMLKSSAEVDLIRQCGVLIGEALEHALSIMKVGMTDVELMTEIEHYVRRRGHSGLMRMRAFNQELITGMVGSGWAAAMPTFFDGPAGGQGLSPASPQSAGVKPIALNEPVLIDIGCCVDGYVIDQTRTAVIGQLDDELAAAYQLAERILHETEQAMKPGASCEQLYVDAVAAAEQAGLADHFMGYGDDQVKFLGHGIGLEIDEWPVLARGFRYTLQPGMVIAVEPKFTFPEKGVVGIENSYHVTDTGVENLTPVREGVLQV